MNIEGWPEPNGVVHLPEDILDPVQQTLVSVVRRRRGLERFTGK
jgi:hypothetical protein